MNSGQPQLYGTQFVSDSDGVLRPQPIQDPESLAARREAVGLEPFEEYEATMRRIWANGSS